MIPLPRRATAPIMNTMTGTGCFMAVDQVRKKSRKKSMAIHDTVSKTLAIRPYSLGAVHL
jgi:hypothetical protein